MQAGVAPVIISDGWIPVSGLDWNEFAIFIPERNISEIYDVLKSHESEYLRAGKLATAAYNKWFVEEAVWDQLLAAISAIKVAQTIPEKWFVRGKPVIYLLELAHEWRYQVPIKLKLAVRWAGKKMRRG